MSSLLDAQPPNATAAPYVAVFATVAAHGALVLLTSRLETRAAAEVQGLLSVTELVTVDLSQPTPPPPAPIPNAPPPTTPRARPTPTEAPPPPAAQAGRVLDAKADAIDFGDAMVVGGGDAYAGGSTDSQGTSKAAKGDPAARGGVSGSAQAITAPAVDLSRPPRLANGTRWDCPFPLEADDAGIDHAMVTLRVAVRADGDVQRVSVEKDPGHGFGREARRCATSKRWQFGLDHLGHPAATTVTINVHFDR